MLQSVAECCRVLQSVAECCRALQSVAERCRVLQSVAERCRALQSVAECRRALQSVAECCSHRSMPGSLIQQQRVAECCVAECCVAECSVAEYCSVLQCVAVVAARKLDPVQPIEFGVSFNQTLQSQSPWSLSNGMWQKET